MRQKPCDTNQLPVPTYSRLTFAGVKSHDEERKRVRQAAYPVQIWGDLQNQYRNDEGTRIKMQDEAKLEQRNQGICEK